ncbi:hypothetical protein RCL1_002041 [Eukaryota sp. TZLM3-RCL]
MQRECPACGQIFSSKDLLFAHVKTCGKLPCSDEPKTSSNLAEASDSLISDILSSPNRISSLSTKTDSPSLVNTSTPSSTLTRSQQMYDRVRDSFVSCQYCKRSFNPSRIAAHEKACIEKREPKAPKSPGPSHSRPSTPKHINNNNTIDSIPSFTNTHNRPSSRSRGSTQTPRDAQIKKETPPKSNNKDFKIRETVEDTSLLTAKYLIEETLGVRVYSFSKSKDRVCVGEIIIDVHTTLEHVKQMITEQLRIDGTTFLKNGEIPIDFLLQGHIPAFCFFKSSSDCLYVVK